MGYFDEIRGMLEAYQSKSQTNKIIKFVGTDPKKMKVLMSFFLDKKWHWRYNQWAAWPVGFIGRYNPELILPYLQPMIDMMDAPTHDAVLRNIVRVFQDLDIPDTKQGQIYERCFLILNETSFPIAVRCFSMSVLFNIAQKHPDLKEELAESIRLHLPHGSSGFKNRGKKLLAKLSS